MRYDCLKEYRNEEFRRLIGVKRSTFEKMVNILKGAESSKKALGGRPNRLPIEDQLLMTLEYIREYRTYFHVAASYQIAESGYDRNIRWIEEVLIKHPDFALPGPKALLKNNMSYEVVLIDATETPIERPKKTKDISTQEKRKSTR